MSKLNKKFKIKKIITNINIHFKQRNRNLTKGVWLYFFIESIVLLILL